VHKCSTSITVEPSKYSMYHQAYMFCLYIFEAGSIQSLCLMDHCYSKTVYFNLYFVTYIQGDKTTFVSYLCCVIFFSFELTPFSNI
jgi:hypothetical protein